VVTLIPSEGPAKGSPTPSENHIDFLDQVRGAAIFIVFASHCVSTAYLPTYGVADLKWNGWFRDFHAPASFLVFVPLTLGWAGVAIFFVVSGFCIHLSHERSQKKSWKIFFIRRFFRIYPPYLLALLFFALAFPWTRLLFTSKLLHVHQEWFYSMVQLGAHLLLVHNFNLILQEGINPAFWSIAVEVQLYLLYPLLYFIFRIKSPWRALWIAGAIEIGLRAVEALLIILHPNMEIPSWFSYEPFIFWFSWTIGAVLADAYLSGKSLPFRQHPSVWLLLMIACYNFKPLFAFCFTLIALATACLISRLLTQRRPPSPSRFGLISRHLQFAGVVSYSAYLIHMPLLYAVPDALRHLFPQHHFNGPTLMAFCLATWIPILVASYTMYRLVELPGIAWGKRVIRRGIW
jgi:peptidoglycan/LPS O-acetylase OafA/YrhL